MAKHTSHRPTRSAYTPNPAADPKALAAQITASAEALAAEIAAGRSERLTSYLNFAARFHHYSVGNQCLIAIQCPDATHVAGYKTWEKLGYHVARGQKAIRILAPRPYERSEEQDDGSTKVRSGLFFAAVPVFDASQLDPTETAANPVPSFWGMENDGSEDQCLVLFERLCTVMQGAGISVTWSDHLEPGVQGVSRGGVVELRPGRGHRAALATLVHEYAHELLHKAGGAAQGAARATKECHAEATAYVVLAHFGIHNELSSDYLQTWDTDAAKLLAELGLVQKAASAIITALSGRSETEAASPDAEGSAA